MNCLVICDEGFEDVVAKKLKQDYGVKCEQLATAIQFSTDSIELVAKMSYMFQGAIKILTDVSSFKVDAKIGQEMFSILPEFEENVKKNRVQI